jgi:hypothetical protein
MDHRSYPSASALLVFLACAGRPTLPRPVTAADRPRHGAARPTPDHVFGIVLRHSLDPGAFNRESCVGARDFAFRRGVYSIVTDDVLFGVPHEHQDTTAVLAALDSFTVCVGETRELNATAVVTISDSVVANLHLFWPDERQAPAYDRMLTILEEIYGEPLRNDYGVQFWTADSMTLYVNRRGFYNEATSVSLHDARACERFERLVHREHPAPVYMNPGSNHCWVQPDTGSMSKEDSVAHALSPPPGTRVRYQMPGDTVWAEGRVMDFNGCIAIVPDDQRRAALSHPNTFVVVWLKSVQRLQRRGRDPSDTTWTTIPEASVKRFRSCGSDKR